MPARSPAISAGEPGATSSTRTKCSSALWYVSKRIVTPSMPWPPQLRVGVITTARSVRDLMLYTVHGSGLSSDYATRGRGRSVAAPPEKATREEETPRDAPP